jgi:hypothetical protein
MDHKILQSYLDIFLKYNPSFASQYGYCEYDSQLENPTIENLLKETNEYINWLEVNYTYHKTDEYRTIDSKIKKRLYDITLLEKPFKDPNYYFNIIYYSLFWILQRVGDKNVNNHQGFKDRLKLIPNLLKTMTNNLKKVPKQYILIWNKNVKSIKNFTFGNKTKKYLTKLLNKYTKKITKLPNTNFYFGFDTLSRIINNSELHDVNIKQMYNEAIKENKEMRKVFIKELNKIDGIGLQEKIENYENNYFLTKENIVNFTNKIYDKLNDFLIETKIIDISFLKNPLKIIPSKLLHMSINEVHFCKTKNGKENRKNNYINLFVSQPKTAYNSESYINVLVHEYVHYIQYEKDRDEKNKLSIFLNNISTGEGVAHFFEEYIFDKGFMDRKYIIPYLHFALYNQAKFIVGYELHVNKITYEQAIERLTELCIYYDRETLEYVVDWLALDTYNFEYYLGKTIIKNHIKKNKDFDVNKLLKHGSIPLALIFDK